MLAQTSSLQKGQCSSNSTAIIFCPSHASLSFAREPHPNDPERPEPSLLDCRRARLLCYRLCSGIGGRRDASGKSPTPVWSENSLNSFSFSCFCSPIPKLGRNGLRAISCPLSDRRGYPAVSTINTHAYAAILLRVIISTVPEQCPPTTEGTMSKLNAYLLFLNFPRDLLERNEMLAHLRILFVSSGNHHTMRASV